MKRVVAALVDYLAMTVDGDYGPIEPQAVMTLGELKSRIQDHYVQGLEPGIRMVVTVKSLTPEEYHRLRYEL